MQALQSKSQTQTAPKQSQETDDKNNELKK